jgi:hypothetical protein
MAFDFPASPTVGDIYTDAASGASYKWDGLTWQRQPDVTTAADKELDATIEEMKRRHEKE